MTKNKIDTADKIDATNRRYLKSEKGKQAQKRYLSSDKGKEAINNYLMSEKGKAAQLRYRLSEKGTLAQEHQRVLRKLLRQAANYLDRNPGKTLEDFLTTLKEASNGK